MLGSGNVSRAYFCLVKGDVMKDNTFGSYLVLNMRRRVVKVLFTLLLMIYYLYMFLLCMGTIMLGNDLSENDKTTQNGLFSSFCRLSKQNFKYIRHLRVISLQLNLVGSTTLGIKGCTPQVFGRSLTKTFETVNGYYLYMFLLCMGTIMLGNDLSENAAAITRSGMFVQTDFINTEATYARVHMSYGIWEGSGTVAVPISILEFLNVMLLPLVCFVGLMLMVYLYCRFYKENRAVKVIFIAGI